MTREQSSPKAVCCASAPSSSDEYGNNKCKEEPDTDDDVVMDHGEMKHDEELKKPQVPQTQQTYWQCAALGHVDCQWSSRAQAASYQQLALMPSVTCLEQVSAPSAPWSDEHRKHFYFCTVLLLNM